MDLAFETAAYSILMSIQTTREGILHRFLPYDVKLATKHQTKERSVVLYMGGVADASEELDIDSASLLVGL